MAVPSVHVALLLLLASPLVFLGRPPKVNPPPVVVGQPAPAPIPAPPPFRHEVPAKIHEAGFNRFKVGFTKTIERVVASKAIRLFADGRLFAFCSEIQGDARITVLDLHTFEAVANFTVPAHPAESLVWSPDMKQLACLCPKGSALASLWILSLENGNAVELPHPSDRDFPKGEFFWWAVGELVFFRSDESPLVLRLDTLAFISLDQSKFFVGISEKEKKRWVEGPRSELPVSPLWRFGIATGVQSDLPPPRKKPDDPWQWSQGISALSLIRTPRASIC